MSLEPVGVRASQNDRRRSGVSVHLAVSAGMLVLMVPSMMPDMPMLTGVGTLFAFFVWAAIAAIRERWHHSRNLAAIVDPLVMGLLMAAPYVAPGFSGHAHSAASGAPLVATALAILIATGWALTRASRAERRARAGDTGAQLGFWVCLTMIICVVSTHLLGTHT